MDRAELLKLAEEYVDSTPYNTVGPHFSDAEGFYGMRIFDKPIMAIAPTNDPLFRSLLEPNIVGEHMLMPDEWLPESKSVVSFFLPSSKVIKTENAKEPVKIAKEWLFGRADANLVALSLAEHLCKQLNKEGYRTCIPQDDPRFILRSSKRHGINDAYLSEIGLKNVYKNYNRTEFFKPRNGNFPVYNSNWSERHIAYVCGLGTFGISTNIITKVGTTGRFVSIITDWKPDEYDKRPYNNYMEYCNYCGECIKRCPGKAIQYEGKDKMLCHDHVEIVGYVNVPRYGCGKCQTGIPCEDRIPDMRQLEEA